MQKAVSPCPGAPAVPASVWLHIWPYELIQGCLRHWAAVALLSGCSSNMVRRKELKRDAASWLHSYLSTRMSNRLHGDSLVMCRNCPAETNLDCPGPFFTFRLAELYLCG